MHRKVIRFSRAMALALLIWAKRKIRTPITGTLMHRVEFDYIIVGAGSAGCAVAARLSEQSDVRVLLLEAGGPDRSVWIHIPLGISKLLNNTKFIWPFKTEPEPELFGQEVYMPRGKVLGGSGSVNGLVWVRGKPEEFDRWRAAGNNGWGFDDLLPYFKKLEDYPEGDPAAAAMAAP